MRGRLIGLAPSAVPSLSQTHLWKECSSGTCLRPPKKADFLGDRNGEHEGECPVYHGGEIPWRPAALGLLDRGAGDELPNGGQVSQGVSVYRPSVRVQIVG
jgi:hypothetical protein